MSETFCVLLRCRCSVVCWSIGADTELPCWIVSRYYDERLAWPAR